MSWKGITRSKVIFVFVFVLVLHSLGFLVEKIFSGECGSPISPDRVIGLSGNEGLRGEQHLACQMPPLVAMLPPCLHEDQLPSLSYLNSAELTERDW